MEKSKFHKLLGIELDEDYNIYDILQLSRIDGLTKTQAAKLAVLRDVISEYNTTVPVDNRLKIKSPNEAAAMMYGIMKGLDHEECWCMFLNRANKVIRRVRMTIGSLTATVFDQKDIMRIALELNATGVILAHNHPSGDPSPSMADVKMTEALNKAGKVLGLAVVDHVILSDSCYYSFNDESKNAYDQDLLKQLHAYGLFSISSDRCVRGRT